MKAEQLPEAWRDVWDERAAIMEYDADIPRAKAELLALRCVQAAIAAQLKARAQTPPAHM